MVENENKIADLKVSTPEHTFVQNQSLSNELRLGKFDVRITVLLG